MDLIKLKDLRRGDGMVLTTGDFVFFERYSPSGDGYFTIYGWKGGMKEVKVSFSINVVRNVYPHTAARRLAWSPPRWVCPKDCEFIRNNSLTHYWCDLKHKPLSQCGSSATIVRTWSTCSADKEEKLYKEWDM